jgi:hypothetical protein
MEGKIGRNRWKALFKKVLLNLSGLHDIISQETYDLFENLSQQINLKF